MIFRILCDSMILFCVSVLLVACLRCVIGDGENDAAVNSYQSSLVEGGKPILRSLPDEEDENAEFVTQPPQHPAPLREEMWITNLRARIKELYKKHGSEGAKPYVRKLVQDAEKENNVLVHVKVKRNGQTGIDYRNTKRSNSRFNISQSQDTQEPQWLKDLKKFILKLKAEHGKDMFVDHLVSPVVDDIEMKHHVDILSIDVNDDGEVVVKYEPSKKKRWSRRRTQNLWNPEEEYPIWLKYFRSRIESLVNAYGYERTKPYIQRAVEELEKNMKVLLHVTVPRRGPVRIDYKLPSRSEDDARNLKFYSELLGALGKIRKEAKDENNSRKISKDFEIGESTLRSKKRKKTNVARDRESEDLQKSEWVKDLKSYVKKLVQRYGQDSLAKRLKPVVDVLEEKHDVVVKDIDGQVFLTILNDKRGKQKRPSIIDMIRTHFVPPSNKEPEWADDLKLYIKSLVQRYGISGIGLQLNHAKHSFEEKYNVIIEVEIVNGETGEAKLEIRNNDGFSRKTADPELLLRRFIVEVL